MWVRRRRRGQVLALRNKKRKLLESAQKYALRGAFDKALVAYQQLLADDPTDANILMRIGDLHLKNGESWKAAEVYVTVSRNFARVGFDAKAVAVAKQVLRIEPERLEVRVELGELYQRMGLPSEALREFHGALEMYRERGAKSEVHDLLKRAAALDPENIPNRLSLAGLMVREGLEDEARSELEGLLAAAEKNGAADAVERVAMVLLEHFPDHPAALRRLGEAKLKAGAAEDAASLLGTAAGALSDDLEVRRALAEALESAGDEEGAQRVWREVAEVYRERGDEVRAREIMQRHVSVATLGAPTDWQQVQLESSGIQQRIEIDGPDSPAPDPAATFQVDPEAGPVLELEDALEPEVESGIELEIELDLPTEPESGAGVLLEDAIAEPAPSDSSEGSLESDESHQTGGPDTAALLAEARVSLEYEQLDLAADRAQGVLQHDPSSDAAREILSKVLSLQGDLRGALAIEQERGLQARAEGNASRATEIAQRIKTLEAGSAKAAESAPTDDSSGDDVPAYTTGGFDLDTRPGGSSSDSLPLIEGLEMLDLEDRDEDEDTPTEVSTSVQLEAVFAAFKEGIQAQLGDEECAAHYDLAIAYREMGLVEDAVQELELARRGEVCRIESLSLLAACKLELGAPTESVGLLEEALDFAKDDPTAITALRYDLGEAQRACGRPREALAAFRAVAAADANFRDVAEHMRELEALSG